MSFKTKIKYLAFVVGIISSNSFASGIPVVDVASNAQQITSYIQDLADYAEQLNQLSVQSQQYSQMVQEYQQKLTEYEHYLKQLEGIKHKFTNTEWNQMMSQTFGSYGDSYLSNVPVMDSSSATFESDLDAIIAKFGYLPEDPAEVENEAILNGINDTSRLVTEAQRNKAIFEKWRDIQKQVVGNEKASNQRRAAIEKTNQMLSSLGDESDLATLQLIAIQNKIKLDQNESTVRALNQILQQQSSIEAMEASRKAERMKKEQERLAKHRSNTTPLSGKDRW